MPPQTSDEYDNGEGHEFVNHCANSEDDREPNGIDTLPRNLTKINGERDTESFESNSNKDSISGVSVSAEDHITSSQHFDSILYDQLLEQNSSHKCNSNNSLFAIGQNHGIENEINKKGLRLLFRMYLGQLKMLSEEYTATHPTTSNDGDRGLLTSEEMVSLRLLCIGLMARHIPEIRTITQKNTQIEEQQKHKHPRTTADYQPNGCSMGNVMGGGMPDKRFVFVPYTPNYKMNSDEFEEHVKSYIRPVPCLLDRPQYLNFLPPFLVEDFSYQEDSSNDSGIRFIGWQNELLTLTLKIQVIQDSFTFVGYNSSGIVHQKLPALFLHNHNTLCVQITLVYFC